ncbi:hypothetical protein ES708_29990 [subsurface metagenome]
MAKPKSPLLSLGARGSIGDTLTFQKRGRLTIARQKPIPTDPKSPAQLAQRQVYREAVAAWNALTPEEQEAYRGVCPGLTPYQCYMKTALAAAPPEPPPEEKTEEQTKDDTNINCDRNGRDYAGQKLFIPNRNVTKLAFKLFKAGNPSGDITLEILKALDDSIILSKYLCDQAELTTTKTWYEVEFAAPSIINEEVRIVAHMPHGDYTNYPALAISSTDEKLEEVGTYGKPSSWAPLTGQDATYRYKYYEVE